MKQLKLPVRPTSARRFQLEEPQPRDGREWKKPRRMADADDASALLVKGWDSWQPARSLGLHTERTPRRAKKEYLRVELDTTGSKLRITTRESLRILE